MSTGWASHTPGRIDAVDDADAGLALQNMMSFDPDHIRANWNQPTSISRVEAALEHAG